MSAGGGVGALPEPAGSRAVLVGGSRYTTLPELASVSNNLGGFAAILRDPGVWGLPESHCTVVANPSTAGQIVDPIAVAAERATDTLLVYYAGHGLTSVNGDLHLGLRETVASKVHTQMPYEWVRDPIRESRARRRIVILDCCYSGRAANTAMGDDVSYAAQAEVDGSFILTATPENRTAQAPADQIYTAFTAELIAILGEGLEGGGELLHLNEIFNHLKGRMRATSRPIPQARDRNNLGAQTAFRNKAFVPGAALRPVTPERRDVESQAALRQVGSVCLRASAELLRRERLAMHDTLYVRRAIDDEIARAIATLGPVNLRRVRRFGRQRQGGRDGPVMRAVPPQMIVVSDGAGTGKSMLAVELSRLTDRCAAILLRAGGPVADRFRAVLQQLGSDSGLSALIAARLPLVCVVDGLDRADHARDQAQVVALIKQIEALNRSAHAHGMLAFPVALVLTLRESEWDRWFTVIEGRDALVFRRAISRFEPAQLVDALDRYAAAFGFGLAGDLSATASHALALPLHVRILAESLEYAGEVDVADALREPIVEGHLRRRCEEVSRLLPWLSAEQVANKLTDLAVVSVVAHGGSLDAARALAMLGTDTTAAQAHELLRALLDARVLAQVGEGIQFATPAVMEYAVAEAGVRRMAQSGRMDALVELTSAVADAAPAASAAVRANVEQIARTEHPEMRRMVHRHYATSAAYVGGRLSTLRHELGTGQATSRTDLESIYGSVNALRPKDAWDAFFVVAAAPNRQPAERVLRVFAVAWDANRGSARRWRMLAKLHDRGLLYEPAAIARVVQSTEPREWETFLALLAQEPDRSRILVEVERIAHRPLVESVGAGSEWRQARGLLRLLLDGEPYVEGSVW